MSEDTTADLKNARRVRPADQPLPPHSDEAEAGVIGCILLSPDCLSECLQKIHSSRAFYDLRFQTIYEILVAMRRAKAPIDLITLQQWLKDKQLLEQIGGLAYLSKLQDDVHSAANLSYWLDIVLEKYQRRKIVQTCTEIVERIEENTCTIDDLKFSAQSDLADVFEGKISTSSLLSSRSPDEILAMSFDDTDIVMGDRLLAKGQNATICGASSVGKSRLAMQMACCCITGRQFLGFETRSPSARWLFIQAENSTRRLQFDLGKFRSWLGDDDWKKVNNQLKLHTLETDEDGFLNLDDESHRASIRELIADNSPDVCVWDSLYNFQIGDLNKDVDMGASLQCISQLTKAGNSNRIPLILHHALTGKAGASRSTGQDRASFSRNSKVLHAWTRGQINVAAGSTDNNETLVISCGKNSNGKEFEPFPVTLNPETMIYELDSSFDIAAWVEGMGGQKDSKPLMNPDRVREVCAVSGSTKTELAKLIMDDCGCYRGSAYRFIARAEKVKTIKFSQTHESYFKN